MQRKGVFRALTSIPLAVALIALIALGALVGTVIPQGAEAEAFASRLSPTVRTLFEALQLFDVYHAKGFLLLLILLALQLIACSLVRFPPAWRSFRSDIDPFRPELFGGLADHRRLDLDRPPEEIAARVEALLRRRIGRVRRAQAGGTVYLAAQKGAFSRLGVYGVHLGILLLIVGGLVGGLWGLKGFVEIAEGGVAETLHLARGGSRPLGFEIRCERFVVEHYDSGAPRLFRSDLAFLVDGRVEKRGALMVNHPLDFGGLRFYQASYGRLPGGRLTLRWRKGQEKGGAREVRSGERFPLPGADADVEVLRAEENLMQMGPAVKLAVVQGEKSVQFWVFEQIEQIEAANPGLFAQVPLMNPGLFAPWRFALERSGARYYTVLQAAKDPGTPLVAFGATLVILGLIVVFFLAHRRLWVAVSATEKGSRIAVAGRTTRDPGALEGEIGRLLKAMGGAEEAP